MIDIHQLAVALMTDHQFTEGEKFVVKAQYGLTMSNFEDKLWQLLCACDHGNLDLMGRAFPGRVAALNSWRCGHLVRKINDKALQMEQQSATQTSRISAPSGE